MFRFLRIISVTAAVAKRGNSVLTCVRVQHSRLIRTRYTATAIAGSDGKTILGPKVGAIALSRGVRHDVTTVHVSGWRPVGADSLRRAAPGKRQHAKIFRLDGWLGNRNRTQLFCGAAVQCRIALV